MRLSREELRAEHERLQAQVARVLETMAPFEAQHPQLREVLERLQSLAREYEQQLAQAEAQIAQLKRELFGPKADRLTREEQEQFEQLIEDVEAETKRPAAECTEVLLEQEEPAEERARERPRRLRHPLPADLETETVTLEPELEPCPCCGATPVRIGEEITEEIDLVPAKLIRRRTVRPKYACRCGGAPVAIAPLAPRLIPQSKLALGLAVHLLLARFDDHLSFYRLEQQFRERHGGLVIARQQMVQWVEHIATWLRPVVDAMWRSMLAGGYLQVDETPVRVLDPEVQGKAARGYLWFYAVPGGDVVLEFDSSRGLEPLRKRLSQFAGTIQTDAYEVYQALERKQSSIERIGCAAHARRYFYKAVRENFSEAVWFITQIRALYAIEEELRGLPPAERHLRRLQAAPAIWERLKARAEELKPRLLPQSTLGKALNYFVNDYEALSGYLADGRFEIDNNLVENAIRPTAVGRKRWLFIGHPQAGWRSAVIYSIIGSCRRRSINPQDYLTDVLARLPGTTINRVAELTPESWKPPPASQAS
jgi:transposase